jgi:membrane-bound serine protease (ClpP class)
MAAVMKAGSQRMRTLSVLALLVLLVGVGALGGEKSSRTHVVHISGTIRHDTVGFMRFALDAAQRRHSGTILIEIDSNSGSLADAVKIHDLISAARLDTIAFINRRATGVAALIPLACRRVVMARGAVWGDAPVSGYADKTTVRDARSEFRRAAETWGRAPEVAASMVPGGGETRDGALTLFPSVAVELGYADLVADTPEQIVREFGLGGEPTRLEPGWRTSSVRILVNPWVTVLLLAVGVSLLIREAMTWRTFGVTGTLGIALVVLVLTANIACGGSWVGFGLFLGGVLALLAEIYVAPGLGLWTLVGVVCIFLGIFLGIGGGRENVVPDLLGALVTSGVGLAAFFACLPQTKTWRKLAERSPDDRDLGIVAPNEFTGYFGVVGLALTDLRPKGLASFAGTRLDVVADGDYVRQGESIEVTRIDAGEVYVHAILPSKPKRRR